MTNDYRAITWICCIVAWIYYQIGLSIVYIDREPSRNRDLERHQILRRLYMESDNNCHDMLRMNRIAFHRLCARLKGKGLQSSRWVDVEEQVALFLLIVGHDTRIRHSAFGVIRSSETVHRHFHNVLQAILKLGKEVVKPARASFSPQMGHSVHPRPWAVRYFKDCVGALDGSFMPAMVPLDDQPRYRNRKGDIRHNVLVACSFDMKITYVLAGWEGSVHDSRMLRSSLTRVRDKLIVPNGKYYLGDAGFPHAPGFMTPYRGTRYHLAERLGREPETAKELYNYRHSSLRNVIERVFGLLKKRFAYLRTTPFYPVDTQIKLILACCILHNIILDDDPNDNGNEWVDEPEEQHNDLVNDQEEIAALEPNNDWTNFRNQLTTTMWNERPPRRNN